MGNIIPEPEENTLCYAQAFFLTIFSFKNNINREMQKTWCEVAGEKRGNNNLNELPFQ